MDITTHHLQALGAATVTAAVLATASADGGTTGKSCGTTPRDNPADVERARRGMDETAPANRRYRRVRSPVGY